MSVECLLRGTQVASTIVFALRLVEEKDRSTGCHVSEFLILDWDGRCEQKEWECIRGKFRLELVLTGESKCFSEETTFGLEWENESMLAESGRAEERACTKATRQW